MLLLIKYHHIIIWSCLISNSIGNLIRQSYMKSIKEINEINAVLPIFSSIVFQSFEGGYYCHKIPYLYRTISNNLIAFAEGRGKDGRASCDDFSGTDLVYKRSTDNGKSWSPLQVFYSNSSGNDINVIGNAAPVQDQSTGRIWVPFCRNNHDIFISFSDDDGISWSYPVYMPHLIQSVWKWVGLGPPSGLQLSSGRLLIPGYHTDLIKGDGLLSRGHTLYSDDHGVTWQIGCEDFGRPYLLNENQAVQLINGSILVNARTNSNHRIQTISNDGGISFEDAYPVEDLEQPLEGCEGSLVRDTYSNLLYFSDPNTRSPVRTNMTIHHSLDEGLTWEVYTDLDVGSVSYSSMTIDYSSSSGRALEILYERSDNKSLIFLPQQIVYVRLPTLNITTLFPKNIKISYQQTISSIDSSQYYNNIQQYIEIFEQTIYDTIGTKKVSLTDFTMILFNGNELRLSYIISSDTSKVSISQLYNLANLDLFNTNLLLNVAKYSCQSLAFSRCIATSISDISESDPSPLNTSKVNDDDSKLELSKIDIFLIIACCLLITLFVFVFISRRLYYSTNSLQIDNDMKSQLKSPLIR